MESDIQFLPGVGPKRAELLRKELGINTFGDLIRLYPFRYIDRSSIVPIREIRPDMAYIQIKARVIARELYGTGGIIAADNIYGQNQDVSGSGTRAATGSGQDIKFNLVRRMRVMVEDATGRLEVVFFKGIKWMYGKLEPGKEFVFFGKPTVFNGLVNIVHPEVDNAPDNQNMRSRSAQQADALTMTGVYPSTERLKNGGITGKANLVEAGPATASIPAPTESAVPAEKPHKQKAKITVPWFAFLFLAAIGFNSLNLLPLSCVNFINSFDTFLLTMAMTALGTDTSFDKFKQAGPRPFLLAALLYIWLLGGGYLLARFL